jgi:PAS domain S-box-containing protein
VIKNRLLRRQLRHNELSFDSMPVDLEQWRNLLLTIERTYEESDTQRVFNENLTDTVQEEMSRLYKILKMHSDHEIQRQEEKLELVLAAVPSIIAWFDRTGRVVGLNDRMASILGKSKSNIIGSALSTIGHKNLDSLVQSTFDEVEAETAHDFEFENAENEKRVFRIILKRFHSDELTVLVGVDITEEIQHQRLLEDARMKTMGASRMAALGEMAAGIAHEINNPLAIISGSAQLICKMPEVESNPELKRRAEKINGTVLRIGKIIGALRTFARDGEQDTFIDFSLKSIIDDSLELTQERIKMLEVELEIPDIDPDLEISCRPTQVAQVLVNLINNSRDAVSKLEEKWIKVEVEKTDKNIIISVTDSGPGIPAAIRAKMFNPFFTTKEVGVGTGLGLSISAGIVKSHNGLLRAVPNSKNTRFEIILPRVQLSQKAS